MNINLSAFIFGDNLSDFDSAQDYVASIPSGIHDRQMLFDALRNNLRFPYFGDNWDALSECLRDLSWLTQRRVVIAHQDIPPLDAGTLWEYLDILSYCVQDWQPIEAHELVVVFPTRARDVIAELQGSIRPSPNGEEKGEEKREEKGKKRCQEPICNRRGVRMVPDTFSSSWRARTSGTSAC